MFKSLTPDLVFQDPPPKVPPSLMAPLIAQAQTNASTPREYQIPDDIRNFFKDGKLNFDISELLPILANIVGAGPRGAYVDTSEVKKPRLKYVPPSLDIVNLY